MASLLSRILSVFSRIGVEAMRTHQSESKTDQPNQESVVACTAASDIHEGSVVGHVFQTDAVEDTVSTGNGNLASATRTETSVPVLVPVQLYRSATSDDMPCPKRKTGKTGKKSGKKTFWLNADQPCYNIDDAMPTPAITSKFGKTHRRTTIRERYAIVHMVVAGFSRQQIQDYFGVSAGVVNNVCLRRFTPASDETQEDERVRNDAYTRYVHPGIGLDISSQQTRRHVYDFLNRYGLLSTHFFKTAFSVSLPSMRRTRAGAEE